MRWMVSLAAVVWGMACAAQDLPYQHSDSVTDVQALVFCAPVDKGIQVPAPQTRLGYIMSNDTDLGYSKPGQTAPAAIGMAFGVKVVMARDIPAVKMMMTRPGDAKPDIWYDAFAAGADVTEYFTFDFPEEQIPGVWIYEGWDQDELLFRVGFTVLPEAAMPDEVALCRATS